jgi:hypothetical protein
MKIMADKSGAEIMLQEMIRELHREGAFVPRLVFRNAGVEGPSGQGYDIASLEIQIQTPHKTEEKQITVSAEASGTFPPNEIFTGILDVERMMFTDETGREYPIRWGRDHASRR